MKKEILKFLIFAYLITLNVRDLKTYNRGKSGFMERIIQLEVILMNSLSIPFEKNESIISKLALHIINIEYIYFFMFQLILVVLGLFKGGVFFSLAYLLHLVINPNPYNITESFTLNEENTENLLLHLIVIFSCFITTDKLCIRPPKDRFESMRRILD